MFVHSVMQTREAEITAFLLRQGPTTARPIAECLGTSYNTAYVTTKRMVGHGYVTLMCGTFTATDYGRAELETLRRKLEWK